MLEGLGTILNQAETLKRQIGDSFAQSAHHLHVSQLSYAHGVYYHINYGHGKFSLCESLGSSMEPFAERRVPEHLFCRFGKFAVFPLR